MNRLECIKSMVPKCNVAADIGTDHGYIAEMLLRENIANKVIATDLNKGPLQRAIEYLTQKNLDSYCNFRLGSGLTVLKEGEAEAVIIAGMGGELISNILDISKEISHSIKYFVLQPMTGVDKLRKYLYENNYKIVDENIVKEYHHYYFIIKVEIGYAQIEDDIYYEISKHLLHKKDEIMIEYMNKVVDTNKKIILNLEKTNNVEYNNNINSLKEKNTKILELIYG